MEFILDLGEELQFFFFNTFFFWFFNLRAIVLIFCQHLVALELFSALPHLLPACFVLYCQDSEMVVPGICVPCHGLK